MSFEEQVNTIERSLGERMVNHALSILRTWLNELGESNPYEQAFSEIRSRYEGIYKRWLSTGDEEGHNADLDAITGDTYRLVDAVYVAMRLHRGVSPHMGTFNPGSAPSVMHYFAHSVEWKDSDIAWFSDVVNDKNRSSYALIAVTALSHNLREVFSEKAVYMLIDGVKASNAIVAEQCLANLIITCAHYDVRIDFFPELQDDILAVILATPELSLQSFETLCALIRAAKFNWLEAYAQGEAAFSDLPHEVQSLLEMTDAKNEMNSFASWIPASESEYLTSIVRILPNTWIFDTIVGDDERRNTTVSAVLLSVGIMDLAWDKLDQAEGWLLAILRRKSKEPIDLIHLGHCCLLRGDRLMALEHYRHARELCKEPRDFLTLFRPERKALVDRGVPLDEIYYIEDRLLPL